MRIRHVHVERFRGIGEMDWAVGGNYVCLIGPGDSTKSTVLDAIELALVPRRSVVLNDCDFHGTDTTKAIDIRVTLGDLPDDWIRDSRYGLRLRGWSQRGELHDEPQRGDELVLTVGLRVDDSLEPEWSVFVERDAPEVPLRWKDRESIGCVRLGDFPDWHLSWTRGSALSRLTDERGNISQVLAGASRAARTVAAGEPFAGLQQGVARATETAARVGVAPSHTYAPSIDAKAVAIGAGGISLHDGSVPVRMSGLATRRLLTLGLQLELAKRGGIVLVDEVENGLEPYRMRHLLKLFREDLDSGAGTGQVLLSTHSPIAIGELRARELRVVRSSAGTTNICAVPESIQNVVKKASEALLSRRVLVCEGMTELGFCRGLDTWWSGTGQPSFGLRGVGLVDGGGSDNGPAIAKSIASLRYPVAYFGDSDVALAVPPDELRAAGATVILWNENLCIEQRVVRDLPWDGVVDVVQLAMEYLSDESVRTAVAAKLKKAIQDLPADVAEWGALGDDDVRNAIAECAKDSGKKKRGWFKRADIAEELAQIVARRWDAIKAKDLGTKISALRAWVDA